MKFNMNFNLVFSKLMNLNSKIENKMNGSNEVQNLEHIRIFTALGTIVLRKSSREKLSITNP